MLSEVKCTIWELYKFYRGCRDYIREVAEVVETEWIAWRTHN